MPHSGESLRKLQRQLYIFHVKDTNVDAYDMPESLRARWFPPRHRSRWAFRPSHVRFESGVRSELRRIFPTVTEPLMGVNSW